MFLLQKTPIFSYGNEYGAYVAGLVKCSWYCERVNESHGVLFVLVSGNFNEIPNFNFSSVCIELPDSFTFDGLCAVGH